MVSLLPKAIKDKLESLVSQSGIAYDEDVVYNNVALTGMPQDDFITSSFVRRAKKEAEGLPEKYRCFGCGRRYDTREEFIACMQDHVKDFMAGIPIDVLPEYEDEQLKSLTPEMRKNFEEMKNAGITFKTDESTKNE